MTYKILIKIGVTNDFQLDLVKEEKAISSLIWRNSNNFSRLLLLKIDQILRKNKIGLDKISGYKIMSKVPENYTSFRIAKITLEGLMIGKEFKPSTK